MDDPTSSRTWLREARLAQIEALEAALVCAERAIAGFGDDAAAAALTRRVAQARREAVALYRAFNTGA